MYGIIIATGILVSALVAEEKAKELKLDTNILWGGILTSILFGVVGARAWHVLDYWHYYRENLVLIFDLRSGGLGIFGAIVLGTLALIAYLKLKRIPKAQAIVWLDIAGLVMPAGQAIGRWGNFFNNELLPFSIYESILDCLLFLILFAQFQNLYLGSHSAQNTNSAKSSGNRHKHKHKGKILLNYLSGYSLIRIILEPIRPHSWVINGVNVNLAFSTIILAVILILYVISGLRSWRVRT